MRYAIVGGVVLVLLILGVVGFQATQHTRTKPFILDDATKIEIASQPFGPTTIRYTSAPNTWRARLTSRLLHSGWSMHSLSTIGASQPEWSEIYWYTREVSIGPLNIHEFAQLYINRNDPSIVSIKLDQIVSFLPIRLVYYQPLNI